jgi:hypothetical protein
MATQRFCTPASDTHFQDLIRATLDSDDENFLNAQLAMLAITEQIGRKTIEVAQQATGEEVILGDTGQGYAEVRTLIEVTRAKLGHRTEAVGEKVALAFLRDVRAALLETDKDEIERMIERGLPVIAKTIHADLDAFPEDQRVRLFWTAAFQTILLGRRRILETIRTEEDVLGE